MNKTKLFLTLFSLLGPATVTQVKALPAPEAPVNEQSIRARIQKIEADIKELGQLPSMKAEATKLLEDIQKWNQESSKKPTEEKVPGAPGRNNVMALKSFSDHLGNIENRFKHPKETANQIQKTLSEISPQIESQQPPAVKATLIALLKPIKQKADSLTSPVSEIDGLIAKIKTELPADSGQKDHPNGFRPNKHPDGIIIPDTHPNGIIIPDTHSNGAIPPGPRLGNVNLEELSTPEASVTKPIIDAMTATWANVRSATTNKKLVSAEFPEVNDANVADFAKAYNAQVSLITTLKALFTGEVTTQFNATKDATADSTWVKDASEKLYALVESLRNDLLTTVGKDKQTLAETKGQKLDPVPEALTHLGTPGGGDKDLSDAFAAFGEKLDKTNPSNTLNAIKNKITLATTAFKSVDVPMKAAYTNVETLANKPDIPSAKTALNAFESKYQNAIKTLDEISTGIVKSLPAIASNTKVKQKAAAALKEVQTAVAEYKNLTTAPLFTPVPGKKVKGKVTYNPSQYQALKAKIK